MQKPKELNEFYIRRRTGHPDTRQSMCKDCERLQNREKRIKLQPYYNQKDRKYYEKHKEEIKIKRHKYYVLNRHKSIARYKVQRAVVKGLLVRPTNCEHCNEGSKLIEAHHPDYSKPLEVVWLCKTCHMREDFGKQ